MVKLSWQLFANVSCLWFWALLENVFGNVEKIDWKMSYFTKMFSLRIRTGIYVACNKSHCHMANKRLLWKPILPLLLYYWKQNSEICLLFLLYLMCKLVQSSVPIFGTVFTSYFVGFSFFVIFLKDMFGFVC